MNLKDLINVKAFPVDAAGFSLVPIAGFGSADDAGPARVVVNEEGNPDYPLVGVGPGGTACLWDEDGRICPDLLIAGEFVRMDEDEIEANSLVEPPSISRVNYTVADENDLVIECGIENEDEARSMVPFGGTLMRVTETLYMLPDGVAGGIEMEQVEVADFA